MKVFAIGHAVFSREVEIRESHLSQFSLKKLIVVTSALLFIGCTQYVWKHPDHNDQARFNRDAYECERDMRQSGYFGSGLTGSINAQQFQERCMVARGYYKVESDQPQTTSVPYYCADPETRAEYPVMCKDYK
jgi:hypothetical protein